MNTKMQESEIEVVILKGFNEKIRKMELERIVEKLAVDGWVLESCEALGRGKDKATFIRSQTTAPIIESKRPKEPKQTNSFDELKREFHEEFPETSPSNLKPVQVRPEQKFDTPPHKSFPRQPMNVSDNQKRTMTLFFMLFFFPPLGAFFVWKWKPFHPALNAMLIIVFGVPAVLTFLIAFLVEMFN